MGSGDGWNPLLPKRYLRKIQFRVGGVEMFGMFRVWSLGHSGVSGACGLQVFGGLAGLRFQVRSSGKEEAFWVYPALPFRARLL